MKLPHTEVKFYPEVKSQTGLSSLRVSCKRALRTGESLDTRIDAFIKSLKPLLSQHGIVKSLNSLSWLSYLGTLSSNLKQKLRTCFKHSLPQCNIKIILKSTNCLSSLFRFKDVIPKELHSDLVYKFL